MTQNNDRAWEIVMENLSRAERDRLLRLAQTLRIDTDDPVWVMVLATSMTRGQILNARKEVSRDIETAIEQLNKELQKALERTSEIAEADLQRRQQQYSRAIEEAAQQAIREAVNREKPRRPWRSIAIAGLVVLVLTATAAGLGAVAGRQEAADTYAKLAARYEGPYTEAQEKLLRVVDGNLPRAEDLMARCADKAFEPADGGRACKVTLWLEHPGGESLDRASSDWLERTWQGVWTTVGWLDDPR